MAAVVGVRDVSAVGVVVASVTEFAAGVVVVVPRC